MEKPLNKFQSIQIKTLCIFSYVKEVRTSVVLHHAGHMSYSDNDTQDLK